jgi:two-component system response regulator FlrC
MLGIEQKKILVVDDESGIRSGLEASLKALGYDVTSVPSGEEAIFQIHQQADFECILTDYKMPGLSGFDVLKEAKRLRPQTPVIMMTGHGNVHHAVEAIQSGAKDYLCKPFGFEELERLLPQDSSPKSSVSSDSSLAFTLDPAFEKILHKAQRVAQSDAPVLIEGPSGTGKEVLAKQIHLWSTRANSPWVAINCAALPAGLLESELFGYERGAFTGAVERKIGKFEQANGGTLLLDEIGEMDPLLQAKLLRVLQESEVDRLGGKKPIQVNVRIIATTNQKLTSLVQEGKFREDLYFRLYGVRFELPALKNRPEDIPSLCETFLERESKKQGRVLEISKNALESLKKYTWPGNIRQLERSVERASILSETGIIEIDDFELENFTPSAATNLIPKQTESHSIKEMEREIILEALSAHSGNRTHTAKTLGMSLRTLRHKLKTYREEGFLIDAPRQKPVGKDCRYAESDAKLMAFGQSNSFGESLAYRKVRGEENPS